MTGRFELRDAVAVVTGIAGNLGPVWARALLDAGAVVLGIDREDPTATPAVQGLLSEHGQRFQTARADITTRSDLAAALERCQGTVGTPDVLVNNAGIDQPPHATAHAFRLEDLPAEASRQFLDVNVLGTLMAMQVFGGAMVAAGRGSIINIGSLYASVAPHPALYEHLRTDPPFLKPPMYGASKSAVVNLTRYFATHWGPRGVRVNALSPGGVLGEQDETFRRQFGERVPLGRMARHEDLTGPLLFLASEASAYVTGIELVVDGGYTAW